MTRLTNLVPPLLLFGFMAVVLLVSHSNSIDNCKHINTAITESNKRVPAHNAEKSVVRNFLAAARDSRFAEYRRSHHESDLHAALHYQQGIVKLDAKVSFHKLPLIDCDKQINFIP